MSSVSMREEDWAELSLSSLPYTPSSSSVTAIASAPRNLSGLRLLGSVHQCPRNRHPFSGPPLCASSSTDTHPLLPEATVAGMDGGTSSSGSGLTAVPVLAPPHSQHEEETSKKKLRLMKNRESAVRSRARKQAYTSELEREVARLVKENNQLKKQLEIGNADEKKETSQVSDEEQVPSYLKKKSQPQFQRAASAPL